MKYKRLEQEDLLQLEKEFVEFLVVNGIEAKEWVEIKENAPAKAEQIVIQFSDVIWEGILRKTKYLKFITPDASFFFKCDSDTFYSKIYTKKSDGKVELRTTTKKVKNREQELFQLIQQGCEIDKDRMFEKV
jgi:hypothetical protein